VHNGLGEIYLAENLLDQAIAEFRDAVRNRVGPIPVAHCNLGRALSRQGKLTQALTEYQKCYDTSENLPDLQKASEQGITETRQLLDLEGKLADYLSGKMKPIGAEQQLELARLCSRKRKFTEAAAFYRAAFASQPTLAAPLNAEPRYEAVCADVQAAVSRGGNQLSDKDRAALHREAVTWLRVDVSGWTKRLTTDKANFPAIQRNLRRWQQDERLAPVRDEAALAQLGEAERVLWQTFWKDVDTLYQRVTSGK
jgi:tetratricopeptide (TPR) repeat protein